MNKIYKTLQQEAEEQKQKEYSRDMAKAKKQVEKQKLLLLLENQVKTYLKQIENKEPTIGGIVAKEDLMESFRQNCIPEEFVNYTIDDYKQFLEQRRLLMAQKIKDYYSNL